MKRYLLTILVALAAVVAGPASARAQAPIVPPARASSPTCTTFDRQGRPLDSFTPGEDAVVRGQRFAPSSVVLLSFHQAPQTAELGRYPTDPSGGFTTDLTGLRVPSWASIGVALIRASTANGVASCEVRIVAVAVATRPPATPVPAQDPNVLFAVWGMLLAVMGGVLTFATYRRWQTARLAEAMSRLNGHGRRPAPTSPAHPGLVLRDVLRDDQAPLDWHDGPGPAQTANDHGFAPALEAVLHNGGAGPARLEAAPAPSAAIGRSNGGPGEPPVLPVGWDLGREPTPVRHSGEANGAREPVEAEPSAEDTDFVGW